MKINWTVRLNNPTWWARVALAVIAPILAYMGLSLSDMTSWGGLWRVVGDAVSNPYILILVAVSVWNTLTDPTTPGLDDSKRAMTYVEPGVPGVLPSKE